MNQKTPADFFLLFLFLTAIAWPPALCAAELVNINTANLTELETLPGVGPSIAQSIIDNRPYASIQDVSRASGIGEPGSSSYENIKDLITVGGVVTQTQTVATSSMQTQTQSQNQAAGVGPPTITVLITTDSHPMAGGGSYFIATAYGTEDSPLPSARYLWNFGDGSVAEGSRVFHTFSYPGRYAVSVTAAYNYSAGIDRVAVEAVGTVVSLEAPGDGSLLIRNKSSKEVSIGLWSLVDGGKSYVIPEGTIILAGEGVRFAPTVTGLGGTRAAELLYPNGVLASAAQVSANSPLRGERVAAVAVQKPAAVQEPEGEVLGTSTSEPDSANGKTSSSLWLSLGALAVLLSGGAWAVHYLQSDTFKKETSLTAEEFDIVD